MDSDHWHSLEQIIDALVALGRLRDAEARARDLVHLAPAKPAALLSASTFYLSQDRLGQALEIVDKVLDIDAGNQRARHQRGFVLFRMEDYRQASDEVRQFASNHPNSVSTHCWLVSRAERNQTKGRSKTLPPRPSG